METALLKSFAMSARTELLREVEARLTRVLAAGSHERVEHPRALRQLEDAITQAGGGAEGRRQIVDRAAYTWFNRIVALRFMDANGYTGIGVVSPAADQVGQPEVLAVAKRGQIDPDVVTARDAAAVMGLLDGTRDSKLGSDAQSEAYAFLLSAYCRHWHKALPFMFEREADYTELLMPSNLLAEDSVLGRIPDVLTEEVCQDVEVIGWLYQFYISERKDEVFAGFKKNKKAGAAEIPAATQLFTPHWIVRYLVENSVGRLWMLNHPESRLVDQMEYYIAPIEEETEFLKVSAPEELTVIDPACGSGHMLTYAFDLLYAIYEEEGYAPSQIPGLILEHNLYGTEIDRRAGALAGFALSMKAAARRKLFLKNPVAPNIGVLDPVTFSAHETDFLATGNGDREAEAAFWNQFEHADTFGALIRPDSALTADLSEHLASLHDDGDLLHADTLERAARVVGQARYLSQKYSVAVANPPYMGSKQMNTLLAQFMKDEYPDGKSDLFASFIEQCSWIARDGGVIAMITMQSWMFLSSYDKLRTRLLGSQSIVSMLHLGARAFDSIGGEVVSATAFVLEQRHSIRRENLHEKLGAFVRLVNGTNEAEKLSALKVALEARTPDKGFHSASAHDFKAIPGSPIVYWLSEKMRKSFAEGTPIGNLSTPLVGLRTGDNARFIRQWWEVSENRSTFSCRSLQEAAASGAKWFPYNKGGAFRRWYGNHEFVVNWENDGKEVEEGLAERYPYLVPAGRDRVRGQGRDYYFSPSVSWSDISSGAPSFRYFPEGFIHGNKGNSLFCKNLLLKALLGVMNSRHATVILEALTPTMTASVGDVAKTPIPRNLDDFAIDNVEELVATSSLDWDQSEDSWSFSGNPLVAASSTCLRDTVTPEPTRSTD